MSDPYAASASVKLPDPPPVTEDPVHQTPVPTTDSGVPQGTSREILAWVDRDPDRAKLALAEEEKSDPPRKGLVGDLKEILKK